VTSGCWGGHPVEASLLGLLARGGGGGHAFGGADEVFGGIEVEEVEVLEFVVFGGFEDVDGDAAGDAIFVYGVEEVKEELNESVI
jgi:hypothetical protein